MHNASETRLRNTLKPATGTTVEDESHVLFYCDRYTLAREKLIDTLKKIPNFVARDDDKPLTQVQNMLHPNITHSTLDQALMKLLSPCTDMSITSSGKVNPLIGNTVDLTHTSHHITPNNDDSNFATRIHARSYAINAASTFISNCFDLKWKFENETKPSTAKFKSIVVVLRR